MGKGDGWGEGSGNGSGEGNDWAHGTCGCLSDLSNCESTLYYLNN